MRHENRIVVEHIRRGMKRKRMTQAGLAEILEAHQAQVSNWLNYLQPVPLKFFIRISELFGPFTIRPPKGEDL